MARTITDQEIALIKAMITRGMKTTDIQFFFNRPDRPVNSGRISNIADGSYSDSVAIPAATDDELNKFLAEHSLSTDTPSIVVAQTDFETDPISRSVLVAMFSKDGAGNWRLTAGETDSAECKLSFSLRNAAPWLRAVAALANNRGGYVFFGIADKDAAVTCKVVGLTSDDFIRADPGEVAARLRSAFDPTPRFQKACFEVDGKMIGVLHIERHPGRPVIATKNDGGNGEIKEGDIFYRYPGASRRISYADLRVILDERDAKTRENILPMIRRLIELGPERAMIADIAGGKLTDGKASIELSEDIIKRLVLVKEGEFNEKAGAPALRLIGDVRAATPVTLKKGSVTRDDLRRDFLLDTLQADPVDYLRTAIDTPSTEWVPLRYFAEKARMSQEDLRAFIAGATGTPGRKGMLIDRVGASDKAYARASRPAAQLQKQLLGGEDVKPANAAEARLAALAVIGLPRSTKADPAKLRALLLRCLELTSNDGTQVGKSEVRKAIARLDEILSSW